MLSDTMPEIINVEAIWQERLKTALWQEAAKLKGKRVLCAHNVVIDYLEFVNPEQISQLAVAHNAKEIRELSLKEVKEIDSPRKFLAALVRGMREGKAQHIASHSPELFTWLDKTFAGPDKRRLGGQAGIIANQMAALKAKAIVVTPILSKDQAHLFLKEGVYSPVVKGKNVKYENVRNAWRKGDPTKINWIFEFRHGSTIRVHGETITAPRANRLIVASAATYVPTFAQDIIRALPGMGKNLDAAMVAGYHHFEPVQEGRSYRFYLKQECLALQKLKQQNKSLMVHFEYVPMEHKEIERDVITQIASAAGSLGINEVEILEVLELLGCQKEAHAIKKNESALTLYHGAKRLLDKLKLRRVHVHAFGYFVIVLRKPYRVLPDRVRDACLFANCVANVKALTGKTVSLEDLKASKIEDIAISAAGINQLRSFAGAMAFEYKKAFNHAGFLREGTAEFKDHYVIVVPAQLVSRPVSTVGLGDVISACSLVAET
jgi:ADP-dependent phosphofructokinase/glucokinase